MTAAEHWFNNARFQPALQSAIQTTSDSELTDAYLSGLKILEVRRVLDQIPQKIAAVKYAKSIATVDQADVYDAELKKLEQQGERLAYAAQEIHIPNFLQAPPPPFLVRTASPTTVRALVIGDYGTGDQQQKNTAATMLAWHRQHPFDFGITTGDNFQSFTCAMKSPFDPLWKSVFEDPYGPLGIDF